MEERITKTGHRHLILRKLADNKTRRRFPCLAGMVAGQASALQSAALLFDHRQRVIDGMNFFARLFVSVFAAVAAD